MAEVENRRQGWQGDVGAVAPEIPDRYLPPVTYRDMPEPLPLRRIVGPGVIILAGSMGAGEYVLWPYIASQIGLVFLWAAVLGLLTQFFINMEVERYTLVTGETAVTGFTRLWRPWWALFVLMAILQVAWPGWATGAATTLTFALGGGSVVLFAILSLVASAVALTLSPVVYQFMEKLGFLKVAIVLVFFAAATLLITEPADWLDLVTVAPSSVGQIPEVPELGAAALFAAVALAGSGGFANLAVSNWIRDKGLGMGAYIPRIVSPITGEEESVPSTGYFFPQDEENLARWRRWWRVANWEQFLTFFAIGIVGIVVMSVLSYSTVFGQDVGTEFDFIRAEGEVFQETVAPWFGTFFWLVGTALLFYTTVANFDAVGRLTADALKINWLAESRFWSESKIYATVVWILALIGTLILASGLSAPLTLLVISAVVTGLIMFVYSILFIKLNRGVLPAGVRMSGFRLAAMVWAVLFFGVFALFTIFEQVRTLLSGG